MSGFNYDELVQKALISVVKEVLTNVAVNGLPGDHHFYIQFRTDHPQTKVPDFLKESHPETVMIVLQHRFWNLKVFDDGFSVDLSFQSVRENLYVPFSALTAFVDPSVKFALQFTPKLNGTGFDPNDKPRGPQKRDLNVSTDDNIIRFDSFRHK